jgi:hypothetical protein
MVITSSFGAIMDRTSKAVWYTFLTADMVHIRIASLRPGFSGQTFTGADWGVVSREEAEKNAEDGYVYFSSKILAEKAIWEFAKSHPQLDIATSA